jgi:hypothetical protein
MVMSEEEYQFALRELPPCELIQIINEYRHKIEYFNDFFYILNSDIWTWENRRETLKYINDLKRVIPEWYKKN